MKKLSIVLIVALCVNITALMNLASAVTLPYTNNLALHLDATQGITTANPAVKVIRWADQSGNAPDAVGDPGVPEPEFKTNILNGLPVVRFFDDGLKIFNHQVHSSQDFTIFAVTNSIAVNDTPRILYSNWDFANQGTSVFLGTTSTGNHTNVFPRFTDHLNASPATLSNPGTHSILRGVFDNTSNVSQIFQNGTQVGNNGTAPVRDFTTDSSLGKQGSNNGERWQGDLAELLIFDEVLSAANTAAVETYLNVKWFGIPEPSSFVLLSLSGVAILAGRRRMRVQ